MQAKGCVIPRLGISGIIQNESNLKSIQNDHIYLYASISETNPYHFSSIAQPQTEM